MPRKKRPKRWTFVEAARILGIDPGTLYRWADRGVFHEVESAGGFRLILDDDLQFLKEQVAAQKSHNGGRLRRGPREQSGRERGDADGPEWMTIPEAAKFMCIANTTLYRRIARGDFPQDPETELSRSITGAQVVRRSAVVEYTDHVITQRDEDGHLPQGRRARPDLWPRHREPSPRPRGKRGKAGY